VIPVFLSLSAVLNLGVKYNVLNLFCQYIFFLFHKIISGSFIIREPFQSTDRRTTVFLLQPNFLLAFWLLIFILWFQN